MTHLSDHTACAACAGAARSDIARTLCHYFELMGDAPARAAERAEALVAYYDGVAQRAHAHELAEQQRAWAVATQQGHRDRHGCDDYEVDLGAEAVREAANRIDPQAQPKPLVCVCGDETGVPHAHPTWADPSPRIVAREPVTGVLRIVARSADGKPCVVQDTEAQR